ncbi:hypothetical protein H8I91_09200 [Serratia fonticola]|uniref:hypothetical protein n=1 Tax=Serratia fonticola TaxID=47917 RepID=UPI0016473C69|nr:hypothetical protein [Serratia fonticola]MBC3250437.1 hypothetical protein [Serratia fonticola]
MAIKLSELIKQLQALESSGAGDLVLFASVGASQAKYEILADPYITDKADDGGPFDLDGAEYVCIKTGN